jgi:hypothetical protein
LYSYEEDHTDALCPIQRKAYKSHAGEAALVQPLQTDEARRMFEMHNRDEAQFTATYPMHSEGITALRQAILKANQDARKIQTCNRKKHKAT